VELNKSLAMKKSSKKPADYKSAGFKSVTLQAYAMLCTAMQLHHAAHWRIYH
jgi:hypothetical protein